MYHCWNSYCNPTIRSSGVIIPVNLPIAKAPAVPAAMLKITSIGIMDIRAVILGSMRKLAEFTPMISSASICCVTRMVPISDVMLEPTFPARIRHMIDDENSRIRISRVEYPTTILGIQGLSMFSFSWMHMTAPIKNDMSSTMGIEFTPSWYISCSILRKKTLHRSGWESTRFISKIYSPNVFIESTSIIYLFVI